MTDDTPPVLYISADTSDLTTRYKATPRMHMAAKAWYPEETVEALVAAARPFSLPNETDASIRRFADENPKEVGYVMALRAALAALPAPDEGEQDEGEE